MSNPRMNYRGVQIVWRSSYVIDPDFATRAGWWAVTPQDPIGAGVFDSPEEAAAWVRCAAFAAVYDFLSPRPLTFADLRRILAYATRIGEGEENPWDVWDRYRRHVRVVDRDTAVRVLHALEPSSSTALGPRIEGELLVDGVVWSARQNPRNETVWEVYPYGTIGDYSTDAYYATYTMLRDLDETVELVWYGDLDFCAAIHRELDGWVSETDQMLALTHTKEASP